MPGGRVGSGPLLPFNSRPRCCGAARRRRHSPRALDSIYVEFTPSRSEADFRTPRAAVNLC